ncbi:MAG: FHA domain-containing protein [Anaerolineae bacterium]
MPETISAVFENEDFPYLIVIAGAEEGRRFFLKGRTRLGRGADNDIVLEDHKVSRHHAVIDLFEWGCTLTDLNSVNGTFVNKARITGGYQLNEGDEIVLGDVRLFYHQPSRPAHAEELVSTVPPAALVPPAQPRESSELSAWVWGLSAIALVAAVVVALIAARGLWLFLGQESLLSPEPATAIPSPTPPSPPESILPPGPQVLKVEMSKSVDGEEKPLQPASVFGPQNEIYCSVQASGLQSSTLSARWYAGEELIHESAPRSDLQGDRYVSFSPEKPLPVGKYRVEIHLDGEPVAEAGFSRAGVAALPFEPHARLSSTPFDWGNYLKTATWITYTHQALGFSVEHPADWQVSSSQLSALLSMTETGVALQIALVPDWKGTPQELAELTYQNLTREQPDAEKSYSEAAIVKNGWAIGFSFKYKGELDMRVETWGLPWKKGGCALTFFAPAGEWDGVLPVFAQMSLSLQDLEEVRAEATQEAAAETPTPPSATGRIVYTRYATTPPENRRQIWVMNLDGTEDRLLVDWASEPALSPDNLYVAFHGWPGVKGVKGLHMIRIDGQESFQVVDDGTACCPRWSPDGRKMAFFAQRARRPDIFIWDLEAKTEHFIVDGKEPDWSPDGTRIVHWSCQHSNCGLYISEISAGNKIPLTDGVNDSMADWAPDGSEIAFSSDRDGNWEIYTVRPDGSGLTKLTDDPGHDVHPAWLPDSKGIVFLSTRDGAWGIWLMDADGNSPRKIATIPLSNEWQYDSLDVGP